MRLSAPLCRKLKTHYAQAMRLDHKTNNFWQGGNSIEQILA